MVTVPGFLLRRLYVKGSLRNNNGGFQFDLKNQLGSGYAKSLQPLKVDGQELSAETSKFTSDDTEIPFSQVSEAVPFTLKMNKVATILVEGAKLDKTPHKIEMAFEVKGLGLLKFDFIDTPADE